MLSSSWIILDPIHDDDDSDIIVVATHIPCKWARTFKPDVINTNIKVCYLRCVTQKAPVFSI